MTLQSQSTRPLHFLDYPGRVHIQVMRVWGPEYVEVVELAIATQLQASGS